MLNDFLAWVSQYHQPTCLAALGGVVGGLRTSLKDKDKHGLMRLLDLATGAILSASVAEYFVMADYPKMALALGLVIGSIGANLLEAIGALTPNIAKGIIDAFLARFGYQRSPKNDKNL